MALKMLDYPIGLQRGIADLTTSQSHKYLPPVLNDGGDADVVNPYGVVKDVSPSLTILTTSVPLDQIS